MKSKWIAGTVATLVCLALAGALVFSILLIYRTVIALFAGLDAQIANATGIGCLVVLVMGLLIMRALRSTNRERKEGDLREEKTATYQLLLDFWRNLSTGSEVAPLLSVELAEKLEVLDRLLLLYGSASVIKAHADLREVERRKGIRDSQAMALLSKALMEVRKDLGADTSKDVAAELHRLLMPARSAGIDGTSNAGRATNA